MKHAIAIARTVVGITGDVASFLLFFSPFLTFKRIWKNKSVEEFHPYPYLAAVLNCVFWVFYGTPVVSKDNILVVIVNSIGLALELGYLSVFFRYSDNKYRMKVVGILLGEAIFSAIIALVTLKHFHAIAARTNFVGVVCVIFGVILYASPLSIVFKVLKTKSVEFMPVWVCFAGFFNGIVWSIYALLQFDLYILLGNGIGALLGAIQLIVYACYYKNTPAPGEKPKKQSEVQLQNV